MTAGVPAGSVRAGAGGVAVLGAAAPGESVPGEPAPASAGVATAVPVVRSLDGRPAADDPGPQPSPSARSGLPARVRDHLELVRAPAVLTVLGDTVAGASAAGHPLTGRRAVLPLASACLYAGGMALNDWADHGVDAVERPERPIPSGRIAPRHALTVAGGLGAAGLALAAAGGGRRALAVAVPLAVAVWLYDARLKDTIAGPAAMAACRGLDVLLGAGVGRLRAAAPAAAAVAAHTAGVTVLSRGEVHGSTRATAATVAAGSLGVAGAALAGASVPVEWRLLTDTPRASPAQPSTGKGGRSAGRGAGWVTWVAIAAYLAQCVPAQAQAARTPTAPAARAATGAGIRAMIPLQAAWTARAGHPGAALALGAVAAAGALLRRATGPRAVSET
ncbi:SCO3242 family prenyltransferase [Cellulomonas sp. PS-H5]|uniref:SCO3242 family prenyltransferase n=1 Tax=Cellulomonas sp. PS-H5 TaxID=2820400 RepID=UPI0027E31768|nr:UbiA family prenyltransferase [Cellulomonas sp. PS-H5]